jgi:hypothetical protein
LLTASAAIAGCGSTSEHVSLIELTKQARDLCPGLVVVGGEHGRECTSNPKPGVGRRVEQLHNEIEAPCKTASPRQTKRVLVCPGPGPIGG